MQALDQLIPAPLRSATSLTALPIGWHALRHTILDDGCLAVLVADVDIAAEWRRIVAANGPADPPSRIDAMVRPGTARILLWDGDGWLEAVRFPLEGPFPLFDRFGDGRWLIAMSRTEGKPNARILTPDGKVAARMMLGDGIEHIAIDAADRIWVGWFDEGVFGNDNWRVAGQDCPPSSNGLACFTSDGRLVLLPAWPKGSTHIADCYGLNVMPSCVWVSPYTEFPIAHFDSSGLTRWWRNKLAGASAIAVGGSHALIGGGYFGEASRLALVALEGNGNGDAAPVLARWGMPLRRLKAPASEFARVWDQPELLVGRSDTLHLVDDGVWYRWSVSEMIATLD